MGHKQSSPVTSLTDFRALGPAALGYLEYVFKPRLRASWGGPMNGQAGRQRICREIVAAMPARAIVETGTFRGTTTEFFAGFDIPVYSVEAHPRYHAFAVARMRSAQGHVQLALGDSRPFLRRLATDPSVPKESVFFYLDAHWNSDLPLAEEITTIFSAWSGAVIMIDDFAVPGDSYTYDDYGPGRVLDHTYIDAMQRTDLSLFYPSLPAAEETGKKRGCVLICNDARTRERLSALTSLRAA